MLLIIFRQSGPGADEAVIPRARTRTLLTMQTLKSWQIRVQIVQWPAVSHVFSASYLYILNNL